MEGSRPAEPADDAALGRLLDAAWAEAAAHRGGPELLADADWGSAPGEATVRAWRRDPERLVLAGTYERAVVGLAAGRVTSGRQAVGVVDCCYVEPGARGVGVGAILAGGLCSWFVERGCERVEASALPGDRATKQLFEALGFSARLLVLQRRLP